MSYLASRIQFVHAGYRAQISGATLALKAARRRSGAATNEAPQVLWLPPITLQVILDLEDPVKEGQLVRAVAFPWFEIIRLMARDPRIIYELSPRQWEELVAGAWEREGYDVILTPRSGDGGKDVIATLRGAGTVRLFDQVKRHAPGNLVTAEEVRAMAGVLGLAGNVSKGIITTTSDFAPGIATDPTIRGLIPYRLDLRPGEILFPWLEKLANESPAQ